MLSDDLLNKKTKIDEILKTTQNDFELFNVLRAECERIDFIDKDIILNFEKTKFKINKRQKKVKEIVTYDKELNKFKKFSF